MKQVFETDTFLSCFIPVVSVKNADQTVRINGNVDLDICYKDFPTIIKAKGLNGWGKEEVLPNPPAPAAEDGISVEVTVDGQKYSGKLNKA